MGSAGVVLTQSKALFPCVKTLVLKRIRRIKRKSVMYGVQEWYGEYAVV